MASNSSVLVTADGEELEALNTDAIITSLSTNLTIAAIIFAIVALLVLLYPEFYTPRLFGAPLLGDKNPPPRIQAACILCGGWLIHLCRLTDEQVMAQAGLDGYMLARTTSLLCGVFSIFTIMGLLFLVPLSYTAAVQEDAVSRAGLDNLPDGSYRLWAWVVVLYVITLVALAAMYTLSTEYAVMRRKFLRQSVLAGVKRAPIGPPPSPSRQGGPGTAGQLTKDGTAVPEGHPDGPAERTTASTMVDLQYSAECAVAPFGEDGSFAWPRTVLVTDIPPTVTDSPQLRTLFEKMYPGQVDAATLITDSGDVDDLQGERDETAVLYETARWLHRGRGKPIQRVVYTNRCWCIAIVCGALGLDPLAIEDSRALDDAPPPPAPKPKKDSDEEEEEEEEVPEYAGRYILNQVPSMEREALSYSLDPFYLDAAFFGEDAPKIGNYCCCCLPCGVCKRGGCLSCFCVLCKFTCCGCCGTVEAALPKLRVELLEVNYKLGEARMQWWKDNHKEQLEAEGLVFPPEEPAPKSKAALKAANEKRKDKYRKKKPVDDADAAAPKEAEEEEEKKKGGLGGLIGGAGFVTFKSVRLAVLASTGYHAPAVDFNEGEEGKVSKPAPKGALAKAEAEVKKEAKANPMASLNLLDFLKAAGKIASTPPMGVQTAAHPLDVNWDAVGKGTREREAAQWFVFGLRVGLLVLYSFLALAVASGGGGGAEEDSTTVVVNGTVAANATAPAAANATDTDSGGSGVINSPEDALNQSLEIFWTIYAGLGQSFLLALLLNLLPTILGIFAKLSMFRVESDISGFMINNLFMFKAWTAIVMVVLGESLERTLNTVVAQPFSLITVLGNQLPAFASFYISFVLLKALADYPRSLVNPVGLIIYALCYKKLPNVQNLIDATVASAAQAMSVASSAAGKVGGKKKEGEASPTPLEEEGTKPTATPTPGTSASVHSYDPSSHGGQGGDGKQSLDASAPEGVPLPKYIRPAAAPAETGGQAAPAGAIDTQDSKIEAVADGGDAAEWEAALEEEEEEEEAGAAPAVPREDLEITALDFHRSPRGFLAGVVDGPGEFDFEDALTELLFVNLLGFVFGGMVPVLPPLIALCFAVMGMTMRYQLIYLNSRTRDTGAAWVPMVVNRVVFALMAQQVVLASLIFLRGRPAAGAMCLLPLLLTWQFLSMLNNRVFLAANKLSVKEAAEADLVRAALSGGSMEMTAMPPAPLAAKAPKAGKGGKKKKSKVPKLSREEEEGILGRFMGSMLKTHAYIPPSLLPHRDVQPGVIVLPATAEVNLKASKKVVERPPPAMAATAV